MDWTGYCVDWVRNLEVMELGQQDYEETQANYGDGSCVNGAGFAKVREYGTWTFQVLILRMPLVVLCNG
jgi:hypothetical protein